MLPVGARPLGSSGPCLAPVGKPLQIPKWQLFSKVYIVVFCRFASIVTGPLFDHLGLQAPTHVVHVSTFCEGKRRHVIFIMLCKESFRQVTMGAAELGEQQTLISLLPSFESWLWVTDGPLWSRGFCRP